MADHFGLTLWTSFLEILFCPSKTFETRKNTVVRDGCGRLHGSGVRAIVPRLVVCPWTTDNNCDEYALNPLTAMNAL